jgi:hypothetical protein
MVMASILTNCMKASINFFNQIFICLKFFNTLVFTSISNSFLYSVSVQKFVLMEISTVSNTTQHGATVQYGNRSFIIKD